MYIVDHGKSWKNHGIVVLNSCGNPVIYFGGGGGSDILLPIAHLSVLPYLVSRILNKL